MALLYDISDWSEQPWWNTGGTRNKKVYQNPDDGEIYYFKESFNKGQRNYKYEFWSEIVASEIGEVLGFNVLPYHIAIRGNTVGCISKSMINPAREELVEGGKYLQAFDNTFDPEDTKGRYKYDFQLVLNAIFAFDVHAYIGNIIDVILFDAFIGNSDRHQENWAIINTHSLFSKSAVDFVSDIEAGNFPTFLKGFVEKYYLIKGKLRPEIKRARLSLAKTTRFAPIYDSGCCFGRELSDVRVGSMLANKGELEKYLDDGKAEIHWNGKKLNHFLLLEQILKTNDFEKMLLESMERILKNFDEKELFRLIKNVDSPLKDKGALVGLPVERKALMIKLLTSRKERIEALYRRYRL